MFHTADDCVEYYHVLAERHGDKEGIIILVLQLQEVFHLQVGFHLIILGKITFDVH